MANDPTTFAELQTTLTQRLNRDDIADYTIMTEVIAAAERRFQREVFIPERQVVTTLSASSASVALPTDFWGVVTVYADVSVDVPMTRVTADKLHEMFPSGVTGTPAFYALEGENMLLGPTPSSTTSIKLTYLQKFTPLSVSQTTNALLTDHPDLYIHACMAELHDFFRDYEAGSRERTKAEIIVESINRSSRRRVTNSGPLAARSPVWQVSGIRA